MDVSQLDSAAVFRYVVDRHNCHFQEPTAPVHAARWAVHATADIGLSEVLCTVVQHFNCRLHQTAGCDARLRGQPGT